MYTFALMFAILAALVINVQAQCASIFNYCNFDVYLWPVDFDRPGFLSTINPGGSYYEGYHTPSNGGGVSLKLNTVQNLVNITQFEYTLNLTQGLIFYDGSNVNCNGTYCPFYEYGAYLDASDPSCPNRTCTPGANCTGFYMYPTDDMNTLACESNANISLYLCVTNPGPGDSAAPTQSSSRSALVFQDTIVGPYSTITTSFAALSISSAMCAAAVSATT